MNARTRNIIGFTILALLIILAWRQVDFSHLQHLTIKHTVVILIPVALATVARTYVFSIAMRPFAIELAFREWFGLGVYASILNLVLPFRSGLSVKALYLKRQYTFGYARFVGMQGALSLTQLFTAMAIGTIALLATTTDWRILAVPLLLTIAIPLTALVLHNREWDIKNRLLQIIANVYHSFYEVVKSEQGVVQRIMANSIVVFVLNTLAIYAALSAMGTQNGLTIAISITIASILVNLVTITPGNFGILEFSAGFISNMLNAGFDDGFLATLVVRAISVGLLFFAAPFFTGLRHELGET